VAVLKEGFIVAARNDIHYDWVVSPAAAREKRWPPVGKRHAIRH
jgi:hypothetical protein